MKLVKKDESFLMAVALLQDMHARLKAGKAIKPNDRDVLMEDGGKHGAPTITEYMGGILQELGVKVKE